MKTGVIFCFSGTGNTRWVSERLSEDLDTVGYNVRLLDIEDFLSHDSQDKGGLSDVIDSADHIGIAFPVHAFNAPSIVFDFIDRLPDLSANPKFTFLYRTSGDPFINGGTTRFVRKRLADKGYVVRLERLFIMPSNIVISFPPPLIKQLYRIAEDHSRLFADQVRAEEYSLHGDSKVVAIFSRIISKVESWGARVAGRHFRTTGACTFCGKCTDDCPTGNIHDDGERLEFQDRCILCMRCIYRCPSSSLVNPYLKFFVLTEGYDNDPILSDASIPEDYLTLQTRGYYKRYVKFLDLRR